MEISLRTPSKQEQIFFTPYADRIGQSEVSEIMQAFSNSSGNPFANEWSGYDAIDPNLSSTWEALKVFKELCGFGAVVNDELFNDMALAKSKTDQLLSNIGRRRAANRIFGPGAYRE